MLARALRQDLAAHGHEVIALDRAALDVCDAQRVREVVESAAPDAVVQCAAYTRVDDAETEEAAAFAVNAQGAAHVARACAFAGARFVYPSTDYVFDGSADRPYAPDARPAPINAYGRSKLAGEAAVRESGADVLIVRTSWLYGAGGRNFVATILGRARAGERLRVVDDQRGSPTWTGTLARAIRGLLERAAPAGTWHAANAGETTWLELARRALAIAGVEAQVEPAKTREFPRPAARPAYSVLDCSATVALIGALPHWEVALAEALAEGVG